MSPKQPATPPPGRPGDRRALLDAYQRLVKTEADKKASARHPGSPPGKRYALLIVGVILTIALGAILVRLVMQEPAPPVETPAIRDASLRLMLYREALHVEAYRKANGQLPKTLAEAGGGNGTVAYQLVPPDGYSLTGTNAGQRLTYTSSEPLTSFLGNSYQVIKERRPP